MRCRISPSTSPDLLPVPYTVHVGGPSQLRSGGGRGSCRAAGLPRAAVAGRLSPGRLRRSLRPVWSPAGGELGDYAHGTPPPSRDSHLAAVLGSQPALYPRHSAAPLVLAVPLGTAAVAAPAGGWVGGGGAVAPWPWSAAGCPRGPPPPWTGPTQAALLFGPTVACGGVEGYVGLRLTWRASGWWVG